MQRREHGTFGELSGGDMSVVSTSSAVVASRSDKLLSFLLGANLSFSPRSASGVQ